MKKEEFSDKSMTGSAFIGVDPGSNGGVSVIDSKGRIRFMSMLSKSEEDVALIFYRIKSRFCTDPKRILDLRFGAIEAVHSSPQQGVVSAFTFGTSYGMALLAICSLDIDYVKPSPMKWQMNLGLERGKKYNYRKRKEKLIDAVDRMYSTKESAWNQLTTKSSKLCLADSVLLALYARSCYCELQRAQK
jgi:hypothetical protein